MLTYGVIADGSLRMAHEKGEIKERYWNPGNIFDEVHVLTLADDDIEAEQVQAVAGSGQLYIYPIGRPRPQNLRGLRRRAIDTLRQVRPDVIRGHGPFLQGYFAVSAAHRLSVPSFVSIHDDISIYRRFWTYGAGYAKITAYQLGLKALGWERYVYAHADRLVPKYEAAGRLLRKSRYRDKVEVIYNSIYLARFQDSQPRLQPGERLRIINVGRQFSGKDQRPLIQALRDIDAELTLVGTGPLRGALEAAARDAGVVERVRFIDAVPNAQLPDVFSGHHVFAMNILQPGISMTVMEAMALGFPVVINRPRWEATPEVCGACARVVAGGAPGFASAFGEFLADPDLVARQGKLSRSVIEAYSGEEMEQREVALITELLGSRQKLSDVNVDSRRESRG
jgi:glycosyltransferase involved in cell wall biosynthesis